MGAFLEINAVVDSIAILKMGKPAYGLFPSRTQTPLCTKRRVKDYPLWLYLVFRTPPYTIGTQPIEMRFLCMPYQLGNASIAVLVPCYNEAATIAKVIDDFRRELPTSKIYVYDNNSSDATADIAREHGAVVRRETRQGKGNVVRQMIRDIDADYYLVVDGDDTYPATAAQLLIEPLVAGYADMAVGDRISNGSYRKQNGRAFHGFGNKLVCQLIRIIYGFEYKDVTTGYRAFTRVFAKTLPIESPGFEIETEISIHAVDKRWRVVEVPIEYRSRPAGSHSKLNTMSDGLAVLRMIGSLFKDYRPLAMFTGIAALFVALGLIVGIPVVAEYSETGLVERFPSAMLAIGLVGIGLLAEASGLILDTTVKSARKDYSLRVIEAYEKYSRPSNDSSHTDSC